MVHAVRFLHQISKCIAASVRHADATMDQMIVTQLMFRFSPGGVPYSEDEDLREQSYPSGRDIAHRPHQLHLALGHTRTAFRRIEELVHGPADVGLDSARKPLRRWKLRINPFKSG